MITKAKKILINYICSSEEVIPPEPKKKHSLKENRTSEDILLLIEHWFLEEIEQENVSCNSKLKKKKGEVYIWQFEPIIKLHACKREETFYCGVTTFRT